MYNSEIKKKLCSYLECNQALAKCILNTVIGLSEDVMDHAMYNSRKLNEDEFHRYIPNRCRLPFYADGLITPRYKTKKKTVENKYLFNEEEREYSSFLIDKCEIGFLCNIVFCGVDLDDPNFYMVLKKLFIEIMTIMASCDDYSDFLPVENILRLQLYIENGFRIEKYKTIFRLIFDDINFTSFSQRNYEFYKQLTSFLISSYFDGYNDEKKQRDNIKEICKELEIRLKEIKDEKVFERMVCLLFMNDRMFDFCDLNSINTSFTLFDKKFLCDIWNKYGADNFIGMMSTIYNFHINELLPDVLLPINNAIKNLDSDNFSVLIRAYNQLNPIFNCLLSNAYFNYSKEIKQNRQFCSAYKNILNSIIELGEKTSLFKLANVLSDLFLSC